MFRLFICIELYSIYLVSFCFMYIDVYIKFRNLSLAMLRHLYILVFVCAVLIIPSTPA